MHERIREDGVKESSLPFVEVKNILRYHKLKTQEIRAVDGVSFSVPKGAFVAIVGASGSGKSTLLSLIAGLDAIDKGEIWIGGAPIHTFSEEAKASFRRAHVGFVFQSFQLFDSCTALENVQLPLEMRGESDFSMARTLLERVGLGDRLSHYPKQLSGGEQQRVALARAFCAQPALLLADEPTGNLDTETGTRVMEHFFALRKEFESTVVMVTHDPKVAAMADVVYRMEAGKLESAS